MVCKEEILLWFRESASYKRIDVICNLLNMCIPFELRFVGTFVETIGKHSYQELRGAELKANNPSEIAAEVAQSHNGLSDGTFRRKVTLYLSLLHSYNHSCAKGIYDILTSSDLGDILSRCGEANSPSATSTHTSADGNILEELLLLFTMAINHPAFTFEQYTGLGKVLMQLLDEEKILHSSSSLQLIPPQPYSTVPMHRVPPLNAVSLPKNYLVKTPLQEEMPAPLGPMLMPGPPPGIPLAPTSREPMIQQIPWSQPPPPNPPSPHYPINSTHESPVHSRTGSPVNNNHPHQVIHPRPQQNAHLSRRPLAFLNNRNENPTRKLVNCIEENDCDVPSTVNTTWRNNNNTRCQNGLRTNSGRCTGVVAPIITCPQQHLYCTAQLEALNLDPESSKHCSSSSESGRSSTSHSPPTTPHTSGRRKSISIENSTSVTTQTQQHRSNRSINGRLSSNSSAESTSAAPPQLPPVTGPPPQTVFTQTVPQPPYTYTTLPPNSQQRCPHQQQQQMFTFPSHQTYRPGPPFTYQPNGELVYPYPPAPFVSLLTPYPPTTAVPPVSVVPPQQTVPPPVVPAKLSCWNCGGSGHTGSDCTEPTIEEITRPGNYQVDFTSAPSAASPPISTSGDCGNTADK